MIAKLAEDKKKRNESQRPAFELDDPIIRKSLRSEGYYHRNKQKARQDKILESKDTPKNREKYDIMNKIPLSFMKTMEKNKDKQLPPSSRKKNESISREKDRGISGNVSYCNPPLKRSIKGNSTSKQRISTSPVPSTHTGLSKIAKAKLKLLSRDNNSSSILERSMKSSGRKLSNKKVSSRAKVPSTRLKERNLPAKLPLSPSFNENSSLLVSMTMTDSQKRMQKTQGTHSIFSTHNYEKYTSKASFMSKSKGRLREDSASKSGAKNNSKLIAKRYTKQGTANENSRPDKSISKVKTHKNLYSLDLDSWSHAMNTTNH